MARLLFKTEGLGLGAMELRLGVNRVGRDPKSDFPITHASVSAHHCEFILSNDGVLLNDCGSTNGCFINGERTTEAWLEAGQIIRLGDVELSVESTDVLIGIPKIEREAPKPPPVVRVDTGELMCSRHVENRAVFQCTRCKEVMCTSCVRMMRIKGGRPLFLCCLCHEKCERIGGEVVKEKKGIFGFLQDTVRLKFKNPRGND